METRAEGLIRAHIRQFGPMDTGQFMQIALSHYYATRDPLGGDGDFTTAPEISQLFGEMIGIALADTWLRSGSPHFHLVEFGPGRGTLMADILRATMHVPGFQDGLNVHMVETSPALRLKQKQALAGYAVTWHDDVTTLPDDAPLLIVANEFFDALPIRQAVMTDAGWMERVVGLQGEDLVFGLRDLPFNRAGKTGDVIEFSPIRDGMMRSIAERLKAQDGVMLAVDYGHDVPDAVGDTFQAVYQHKFCSPLEHVGDADLTSHVDFARLRMVAEEAGCRVYGSATQGDFLEALGIRTRLEKLADAALESGVVRLVDPGAMGTLFRVIGITGTSFSRPPVL